MTRWTLAVLFTISLLAAASCATQGGATLANPGAAAGDAGKDVAPRSVRTILRAFAEDFSRDAIAYQRSVVFGVQVTDATPRDWHIVVEAEGEKEPPRVTLEEGQPAEPTFYYTLDRKTLARLDQGQLTAMTAMAKAFSTDAAPMDIEGMEGFAPEPGFAQYVLPLTFHFWNRGFPEIVKFGEERHTREVHGANATVFYYQPGIRLIAVMLKPGQHANENPDSRTNPFPTMLIVHEGKMESRIGGVTRVLEAGEAVFIGPEVSHEFLNPFQEAAEAVLVMFGEGA